MKFLKYKTNFTEDNHLNGKLRSKYGGVFAKYPYDKSRFYISLVLTLISIISLVTMVLFFPIDNIISFIIIAILLIIPTFSIINLILYNKSHVSKVNVELLNIYVNIRKLDDNPYSKYQK